MKQENKKKKIWSEQQRKSELFFFFFFYLQLILVVDKITSLKLLVVCSFIMNLVIPSEMQVLLFLVLYNCKFCVQQISVYNSATKKDETEETNNFPKAMLSRNIKDSILNGFVPHSSQKIKTKKTTATIRTTL